MRPARRHEVHGRRRRVVRVDVVDRVVGRRALRAVEQRQPPPLHLDPRAEGGARPPARPELRVEVRRAVVPGAVLREAARAPVGEEGDGAVERAQQRDVAREDPEPVADHRAAEREARLELTVVVLGIGDVLGPARVARVELQRRPRGRVEDVVGPAEERLAVPGVAPGLRDRVQHSARRAAVLRAVARRLHLQLLHEVGHLEETRDAVPRVGRLGAVHEHAVLGAARAVDRDPAQLALVVGPGHLRRERGEVAPARHLLDLLVAQAGGARAA